MEVFFEPTGTNWQESQFAQPKVARSVKYMDVLSESVYGVPTNEVPNGDLRANR
jgi:hypothetical protein